MDSVISLLAGMLLVGSVIYRVRTFKLDGFCFTWKIATFVYTSIAVGLILSNLGDVKTFEVDFVDKHFSLLKQSDFVGAIWLIGFAWIVSSMMWGITSDGTLNKIVTKETNELLGNTFGGVFILASIVLIFLLLTSILGLFEFGRIVLFVITLVTIATVNSLLGVVALALNVSLVVIGSFAGSSANFVDLLSLINVVKVNHYVIGIAMLALSTVIGSM